MNFRRTVMLCGFALVALPALAAPEAGNMMKMTVTSTVDMPGIAFKVPPTTVTQNVCTSAKKPDPRDITRQQKGCKVTDYQADGSKVTYSMACSGDTEMTGKGSFDLKADGGITGKMQIDARTGGQSMKMDMSYVGVRTGSCDYTPPADAS